MDIGTGWGILAGFTGATVFLAAYAWGRRAEGSSTTAHVGTNTPDPDCETACSDLEQRRQERCVAALAEAAAKSEFDARDSDFKAAAVAVGVLTAAALTAGFTLPWPANLIVSLIAWTLVTVALGMMMFFLGKKITASDAWVAASKVLMDAQTAVNDARNAILSKCPMDRAEACLNRPDPC